MSEGEEVVFYEDFGSLSQSTVASESGTQVATTPSPSSRSASKPTVTAAKRQLTLVDMFSSDNTSSKRLKMSSSQSSVPSGTQSASSTMRAIFGVTKLNSIPFSLKEFKESLNEEQAKLLRLECEVMGKSWLKLLKDEITKPYFIALKRFLWEAGVRGSDDTPLPLKVYPAPKDIYSWSQTPLGKVKVVIIGQDPYHGPNQAHGLCFSVRVGVAVPPSLINIYAEIKREYPEFEPPRHGHLASWAAAGVLMLNSCLTVEARKPNSHSDKGWEQFTDKVLDVVDKYGGASIKLGSSGQASGLGRGVVFLAWGNFAEKRVARLDKTKHLILKSAHPSPRSANKGFLGNGHFKAANEWLQAKYGPEGPVDWCHLEASA